MEYNNLKMDFNMEASETKGKEKQKLKLLSLDDLFFLFGTILCGISSIISIIYGHLIAGIILAVCTILLICIYILKMI